ncbi:MAG: bifunctional diaminohydroxyphosphoribosylaminopyrimidine deaminase/5-amino-6-(5-phosphoribosylamino)uracil reductase RibD [Candidatus Omnitrophica bacterium]|nr:bifunctional diaminohydroxyphosphoribosylaminopyrimidine deaminase/5-amino-6-(5-phosphoribosylamino)uracil reductase RibD [Candidatus Omnitrophota bacterium]
MTEDEQWMSMALKEAEKGRGKVEPSPMVGAVIVEKGKAVSVGHYNVDGGPHAEIIVLNQLKRKPLPGAVLYVTLEPCSTRGRTGACTEAIIKSGISTVVIGTIDPNPAHQGRGIDVLKKSNIIVRTDVLETQCTVLNKVFNEQMKKLQ